MGKIVKGIGKIFGGTGDETLKAAETQAAATRAAADQQVAFSRQQAQATQMQQEALLSRQRAQEAAKAEDKPLETPEVDLAADDAEKDPLTGRRRAPRQAFMSSSQTARSSGISI